MFTSLFSLFRTKKTDAKISINREDLLRNPSLCEKEKYPIQRFYAEKEQVKASFFWDQIQRERIEKEKSALQLFSFDKVETWNINIFDDFERGDDTSINLELSDIPISIERDVMEHVYLFLKLKNIPSRLNLYDSLKEHPKNLLREEGRLCSFERWEVVLFNVTDQMFELCTKELKSIPTFKNKPFHVSADS